ncbi:MAG: DUF4160 domain-containing protein [Desulfomonilaceae bacterium]|nr:DUF4160 domain-containing protein [Desulfomonilaceae bacterium]
METSELKLIPGRRIVPVVAQLGGIKINLYYNEDHGPPHVHVWCDDDHWTWIAIETLELLGDAIPAKCYRAVREWMEPRRDQLMESWHQARQGQRVRRIP